MPDRAHAASRRTMVPRPAGTGTGVSSPWGSDDDADEALHQHEEESEGKSQAWTATISADSDQAEDAQQPVIVMHRSDDSSRSNRHPDNSDNGNSDNDTRWPCPRCTLHNPAATSKCVACNFKAQQPAAATTTSTPMHPQDHERLLLSHHHQQHNRYRSTNNHRNRNRSHLLTALERELVQSNSDPNTSTSTSTRSIASHAAATSTFAPSFQSQSQQSQAQQSQQGLLSHTTAAVHFLLRGAFVGSLLGVVLASVSSYVVRQGEYYTHEYGYPFSFSGIISSYQYYSSTFWGVVLEVALSGAIGGAIVHSVWEQQRAIQRARLVGNITTTSSNDDENDNNDNNNSRSQHQDIDDPAVAFIMRSMMETAATSRPSSRQTTPAMSVDGNGSSSSMLSYEYFLTGTIGGGGNGGSERNENVRAAVEQDIRSLPTVQVLPDMDPNKLPEDCRQCAICLDAFLPGSFRKTLPCWHGFHTQCVDKWLRSVGACPICKHRIDG